MKWRWPDLLFVGIAALALILALGFHADPVIVDALAGKDVPGYGISISPWRTLFEPLLGPLLFLLRGERTLVSFIMLLAWIALCWLVCCLAGGMVAGNGFLEGAREGSGRWMLGMPLLTGTWLAMMWFVILTPLPSNTILNLAEQNILVNTHAHTDRGQDGIITPDGLHRWHRHNGFDAYFLTEHDTHVRSLETVMAQQSGKIPGEPLILCGEEYSGTNDMTLLGVDGSFSTAGKRDREVIELTHRAGGVVIVAHWFEQERESVPYYVDLGVDGFEIANQAVGNYDRDVFLEISRACSAHGLIMNGSVDNHGYGITCGVWTALKVPGWKSMDPGQRREAVMEVLRAKDQGRIGVLLYRDRPDQRGVPAAVLPLVSLVHYFRSLNGWQLLSWLLWLFIVRNLAVIASGERKWRIGLEGPPRMIAAGLAGVSAALYMIVLGIVFHTRALGPEGYEGVYNRYSLFLLVTGSVLLLWVIFLAWLGRRKRLAAGD